MKANLECSRCEYSHCDYSHPQQSHLEPHRSHRLDRHPHPCAPRLPEGRARLDRPSGRRRRGRAAGGRGRPALARGRRARRALRRRPPLPHAAARAERRPQHRRRQLPAASWWCSSTTTSRFAPDGCRHCWPPPASTPTAQVFTGPIRPRLEGRGGWSRHSCGREGPPITSLDLGPRDTDDVRFAWGANMTVRRAALSESGPSTRRWGCTATSRSGRNGCSPPRRNGDAADPVRRRGRARASPLPGRRAPALARPRRPCSWTRQPPLRRLAGGCSIAVRASCARSPGASATSFAGAARPA